MSRGIRLGGIAAAMLVALCGFYAGVMQITAAWRLRPDGSSLGTGKMPVFDFMNLWAGGYLAREGRLATLFDRAAYMDWLHTHLSPFIQGSEWSYPPTMLLIGAPLSLLSINAAYLTWTVGTMLLLAFALRLMGANWAAVVVCLVAPASLLNIMMGHNGAFTAALLLGGLFLSHDRPWLAGVLLGVLTTKPQLGVLVPFCLLAAGNWRAVVSAGATAVLLALGVAALFGHNIWLQFLRETQPMMTAIMEAPWPQGYMQNGVTLFWLARFAGAGVGLAYAVQIVAALCCVVAAIVVWRRNDIAIADRTALVAILSPLATPYGYGYDLVAASAGMVLIGMRYARELTLLPALVWTWPALQRVFVVESGYSLGPIGVLFVAAGLIYAWRLVWSGRARDFASALKTGAGGNTALRPA